MSTTKEGSNAGYSQISAGPTSEVLSWKCEHLSVYSAIHSFAPGAATPELIDQTKNDLLAYYQTVATCGCTPITTPVAKE